MSARSHDRDGGGRDEPSATRDAASAVRAYFAGSRAHDIDAWVEPLAEDAAVFDPVGAAPIQGQAALRQYFAEALNAFDRFDGLTEAELFATGGFVAASWRAGGIVQQHRIEWRGINTFHVDEVGKIRELKAYFDNDALQAQLSRLRPQQ